jgi:hypothetical protein
MLDALAGSLLEHEVVERPMLDELLQNSKTDTPTLPSGASDQRPVAAASAFGVAREVRRRTNG